MIGTLECSGFNGVVVCMYVLGGVGAKGATGGTEGELHERSTTHKKSRHW